MRLGIQEQKEAINWAQTAIIIITILVMVALVLIYFRTSLFKLLQRLVGKA
jgi:CHASE3 domain sensor protein